MYPSGTRDRHLSQEQADNVTRPKYADLFEKYNYNKRPLCIPETLYDGEVDVCTFQQNPDAEDLTLGDEDTLGDLMEGDDELAEPPILSSPAAFSNASVQRRFPRGDTG
ncbi:hypothetical protein CYMTET_13555 [Cymbomonas tetramitiformis]|uniref:Uncharacterized protein n=1 Tax=Cymbomonas tetramitiformis TaxID=36881 RepID=A0AAE0GI60_9CHLO|nr:hypothetical protein CYMTET_13555 [Cymbomonas tetramitiformis]